MLLFSLGVSFLTGIVFGLVPALQTSKPEVTDALKAGRSTSPAAQGGRSRNLLVVIEVALSVVLLVSAGLTVRTFFVLQNMDAGIDADRVLLVGVPLPPANVHNARPAQPVSRRICWTGLAACRASRRRPSAFRLAGRNRRSRSSVRVAGRIETDRDQPGRGRSSAHVRHSAARAAACSTLSRSGVAIASP